MGHNHHHRTASPLQLLTVIAATVRGVVLLPRCGLLAQPASATRRLVDTHHHYRATALPALRGWVKGSAATRERANERREGD